MPQAPQIPQHQHTGTQPALAGAPFGTSESVPPAEESKPKGPRRGDFDAGAKVRLPNGPDEMGKFATFNWIAVDGKAKYYLLDTVTASLDLPIALKKPDTLMTGEDPSVFGGALLRLEAMLPKLPKLPGIKYDTEIGLAVTAGYMREGALLLSEKDYPLFVGDFKPGLGGTLITKVKLSSLVDFSLVPSWVYQSGTVDSHAAVQLPMSLVLKLGEVVKVSADLGVFTGDQYSFRGSKGGRITAGGSLSLKIGPILAHAGAGVASLLTGGMYPTISDSVYIDLNVKYVK